MKRHNLQQSYRETKESIAILKFYAMMDEEFHGA